MDCLDVPEKRKSQVTRLTNDQIEFAKSMSIKQRNALHGLAMFDSYMSASEAGDDELRELVSHQLARYPMKPGDVRISWGATDAGMKVPHRIRKGIY